MNIVFDGLLNFLAGPAGGSFTIASRSRAGPSGSTGHVTGWVVLHTDLCDSVRMPTNLAIDDRLLEEARAIGGHRTKKETVTQALQEYIQRRRQSKILDLFGTIEFDPHWDYKKQRRHS